MAGVGVSMFRIGRRSRIGGVLIIAISCLASGVWFWVEAESHEARHAKRAFATGRFAEAFGPASRWLQARPDSAEAKGPLDADPKSGQQSTRAN
jgi:hypothetical protein